MSEWRMVVVVILIMGMLMLCIRMSDNNYKRGQIDALTGKIMYEQIETKTWVKKVNK